MGTEPRQRARRIIPAFATAIAAATRGAIATAIALGPVAALGQTPAERAASELRRGMAEDQVREAAPQAGGRASGSGPAARAGQLEEDRSSIQPGAGRPERRGGMPDARRSMGDRGAPR